MNAGKNPAHLYSTVARREKSIKLFVFYKHNFFSGIRRYESRLSEKSIKRPWKKILFQAFSLLFAAKFKMSISSIGAEINEVQKKVKKRLKRNNRSSKDILKKCQKCAPLLAVTDFIKFC